MKRRDVPVPLRGVTAAVLAGLDELAVRRSRFNRPPFIQPYGRLAERLRGGEPVVVAATYSRSGEPDSHSPEALLARLRKDRPDLPPAYGEY